MYLCVSDLHTGACGLFHFGGAGCYDIYGGESVLRTQRGMRPFGPVVRPLFPNNVCRLLRRENRNNCSQKEKKITLS